MAEKKAPEKTGKKAGKKAVYKGDAYKCGVCGLVVTVEEPCSCVDACDIVCCGEGMKATVLTEDDQLPV